MDRICINTIYSHKKNPLRKHLQYYKGNELRLKDLDSNDSNASLYWAPNVYILKGTILTILTEKMNLRGIQLTNKVNVVWLEV